MRYRILILASLLIVLPSHEAFSHSKINEERLRRDVGEGWGEGVSGQCQSRCSTPLVSSSYSPQTEYAYRYEGELKSYANPTEFVGLYYSAGVQIQVINRCNFILKLTDVELWDFDLSRDVSKTPSASHMQFKRALEADVLNYAFDAGLVTSICPSGNQEAWVLNVKRAILSSLQFNVNNDGMVVEEDVSGGCETIYTRMGEETVKKMKDLHKCSGRQSTDVMLQGVSYQHGDSNQRIPLLKSTQECVQKVSEGIVKTSQCTEQHSYDPFPSSDQPSRASVETTANLTFVSHSAVSSLIPLSPERVRKSLKYDHEADNYGTIDSFKEAQSILEEMDGLDQGLGVDGNTAELFLKLIKQLEKFSYRQFRLLSTHATQPRTKAYLWDALPLVGTSEALKWMEELYDQVDVSYQKAWLAALAFIKKPSLSALLEAESFLQKDFLTACLPYSSMYNNYITQANPNKEAVKHIPKRWSLLIKRSYRDSQEEEKGIFALKALGNIGELDEEIMDRLYTMIIDESVRDEMRVYALNSLRRQACSKLDLDLLADIYLDQHLDSEVRINSYLQRVRCMDEKFLSQVEMGLRSEEINQVGSYVWTHLSNLMVSQSPHKEVVSKMLERIQMKGFDLDKLKFSRNFEWSQFNPEYNLGGSVESNLIWSEKSFIPRSANLNMTLDLFGSSINFLELGVRTEGIENLVEQFLSTYPQQSSPSQEERDNTGNLENDGLSSLHDSKYDQEKQKSSLLTSIRVFGNEISAHHYSSFEELINQYSTLDLLRKLSEEQKIDVIKNMKMFDASFTVPSLVGLPLKLHAEGAASLALILDGKFTISSLFDLYEGIGMYGSLRPSASVVVKAELGVDSKVIKSGLKLVSKLRSNTAIDAKVLLKGGNMFELDWSFPYQRTDIISLESKMYLVNRNQMVEKIPEEDHIEYTKCFAERLTHKVAGINFCYQHSKPSTNAWSLASIAPYMAKFYIQKVDTVTNYHLEGGFIQAETDPTHKFFFKFDTPGSTIDRKLLVLFELNSISTSALFDLRTPWKSLRANGGYTFKPELFEVHAGLLIDEVISYGFDGRIPIVRKLNGLVEYSPEILLNVHGLRHVRLVGVLSHDDKRVNMGMRLMNVEEEPIEFEGNIVFDVRNQRYEFTSRIISEFLKVITISNATETITQNLKGWFLRSESNYKILNSATQTLALDMKLNDFSNDYDSYYKTELSILATQFPIITFSSKGELEYSRNSYRTKLDIGRNPTDRLILTQHGLLDFYTDGHTIGGNIGLEAPYKDIEWIAEYKHTYKPGSFNANTTLIYDPDRKVFASLFYKNQQNPLMNFLVNAKLDLPQGLRFYVQEKIQETSLHHYKQDFLATFDAGYVMSRAELIGLYSVEDYVHNLGVTMRVNNYPPLEIDGALRPHWNNLKVKLTAIYEETTYGIEGNIKLENNDGYLMITDLQVFYPKYRPKIYLLTKIEAGGSLLINGSLEITDNMKYSTLCILKPNFSNQEFLLKFNWPENYASLRLEGFSAYTDGYSMLHAGRFTSSITGLENIGIEWNHETHSQKVDSKIKLFWSTEKFVEGNLKINLEENGLTFKIQTPFETIRMVEFVTKTKIDYSLLDHNSTIMWNDKYIGVSVNVEKRLAFSFLADIQVKSSYPFLDTLFVRTVLDMRDKKHFEFTIKMPHDRTFSIISNLEHSNHDQESIGALIVEIPDLDFPKQEFSWYFNWKNNQYNGKLVLYLLTESITLVSDGSLETKFNGDKIVNFNLKTESPNIFFNDLGVSLEHNENINTYIYNTKLNGRYGDFYQGHFYQTLSYLRNSHLKVNFDLEFESDTVHRFELSSDNKAIDNHYHSNSHFYATNYGGGNMTGFFKYDGMYEVNSQFKLTTLPLNETQVELTLTNLKLNDAWTTSTSIIYKETQIWKLKTLLKDQGNLKDFDLELSTSLENFSLLKISGHYENEYRNYRLNAQVEHNLLEDKIALNSNFYLNYPALIRLEVNLTSPLEPIKFFSVGIDCRHTDWDNRYNISGHIKYNDNKFSVSCFNSIQPYYHFSEMIIMEIPGYNTSVQLFGFFFLNDSELRTEFILKTPFESVKKLSCKLNYTGNARKFNESLSLEYNDHQINENVQFDLSKPNYFKFLRKVESNSEYLKSSLFHLEHSGPVNDFKTFIIHEYSHEPKIYYMFVEVKVLEAIYGKMILKTPIDNLETFIFDMNLLKEDNQESKIWTGGANVQLNDEEHFGNVNLVVSKNNSIGFEIDFNSTVECKFVLNHKGTWNNFNNDLYVRFKDQYVNGSLSFDMTSYRTSNTINGDLEVTTSFENFKKAEIIFDHSGPINLFTTNLELVFLIPSRENIKFRLQHNQESDDFHSIFLFTNTFQVNQKHIIEITHKQQRYDIHSLLELNEDIIYKADSIIILPFNKPDNHFQFKLNFDIPSSSRNLYTIDIQNRAFPGSIDASGQVSTPFEGYSHYKLEFKHRFARSDVETNVQIFKLDEDLPIIDLKVKGQIESVRKFDLLFQIKSNVNLQIDYELTIFEWKKFISKLEMIIPNEQLSWCQLNFGYSVISEAPDMLCKLGFKNYNNKYASELVLKFNDGLKLVYGFETPIENYEKFHFGLTGLQNSELLELGVETAAPFLSLSHFKLHHLYKGTLRNFITKELLCFTNDGIPMEFIIDSSYRKTRSDDNEFNLELTTSFDALNNIKISHESVYTTVKGNILVIHSGNKQSKFEYDMKNERGNQIEQILNLILTTNANYANFRGGYQQSQTRHSHFFDLSFDQNKIKPDFSYKFDQFSFLMDGSVIENGVVIISSDAVSFKSELKRKMLYNLNHLDYEFYIECLNTNERFGIKTTSYNGGFKISFEHPLLPRDTSLTTVYNTTDSIFDRQVILILDEDEFSLNLLYDHSESSKHYITLSLLSPSLPINFVSTANYLDDHNTNALELSCSSDSHKFLYSHKYDKIVHNFDLKLLSPYSSSSFTFLNLRLPNTYYEYKYHVIVKKDELYFKQTFNLNLNTRFVELNFHLNEKDSYQIYGLLESFTDFKMAVNYVEEEGKRNDVTISFLLDPENYLKINSFIQPNFTNFLWERLNGSQIEIENSYIEKDLRLKRWNDEVNEEMVQKKDKMEQILKPYINAWEQFREMMGRIDEKLNEGLKRMYEDNLLFIADIDNALGVFTEIIKEFFSDLLHSLYLLSLQEWFEGIKEKCNQRIESFLIKIEEWKMAQNEAFLVFYRHLQTLYSNIIDYFKNLLANPYLHEYMQSYSGISFQNLLESFLSLFNGLLRNTSFNAWVDALLGVMLNMSTYLEDIISLKSLSNFQASINQLLTLPSVKQKLLMMKVNYLRLEEWGWVMFDPLEGIYDYQLYIPFTLPSLSFLLDSSIFDYLDSIYEVVSLVMEKMADIMEYIAVMDEPDALHSILPFQFSAFVSGLNHYRTFDGRIFSFAGDCAYLLARDFREKTFSCYVVYENNNHARRLGSLEGVIRKHFVVVSEGKKFEFHKDGRVTTNGRISELPIRLNNIKIIRSSYNEVQLISDRGFGFKYDLVHDIFSLKVSGWYHGRVRGLMGWNDNEPANDLVGERGTYVGLFENFKSEDTAQNWLMRSNSGQSCSHANQVPTIPPHDHHASAYEICHSLFNNTSSSNPLLECYKVVPPTNYIHMCLADMKSQPQPQMACVAATTYHHNCKQLHVHVRLPSYCVTCQGTRSTPLYKEGETLQIERSQNLTDIVFVVEEGECQRGLPLYFSELVNQLGRSFTEKGINAKYAFVTYGLSGGHPQIRTVDGSVFSTHERMAQVQINSFNLEMSNTAQQNNGMQAIDFASKMTFRAGSTKALVSIPCTPCSSLLKWDFLDLYKSLQQHDIVVHVIHPSALHISPQTPYTSVNLFGVNQQKAFLRSQTERMEVLMKEHVKAPIDHCTGLSQASEGSVFSIAQYLNSSLLRREFLKSFASVVSNKTYNCQECVCVTDSVAEGRNMCSRCHVYSFEPINQRTPIMTTSNNTSSHNLTYTSSYHHSPILRRRTREVEKVVKSRIQ